MSAEKPRSRKTAAKKVPTPVPGPRATRTIAVEALARVEGEGGLHLKIRGDRVEHVRLNIYEPPRFFEALLVGRRFTEAPDITARICGICPVAYQMSACHALEDACGVKVEGPLRALRRLLYCGEWIESHALHVVLLHAPDFVGHESGISMATDFPEQVGAGLAIKKLGNDILTLLGGRSVHPINVRVGGFYRVPTRQELATLVDPLERARDRAEELVAWVAGFDFPDFAVADDLVSLVHPDEYPYNEGRVVTTGGLDVDVHDFERFFIEEQADHSHALHSRLSDGRPYRVGPLARFALNFDRLRPRAQAAAAAAGIGPDCRNPFQSIVVRAVETLQACDEALDLIAAYRPPDRPWVPVEPRAGVGMAATEAPRGLLYHRYKIDADGLLAEAKIVPPTAQTQAALEHDLGRFAEARLDLPEDRLTWQCEQTVRNEDPCISCATHFLRLTVDRG